jgi:L-fucose mutarotase
MGLLKGIDPILTADLLYVLRSMGHGDKLCICDCNFPAYKVAKKTTSQKCIVLNVSLPEALDAICSVFPLDYFVSSPACFMAPQKGVDLPPAGAEVHAQLELAIRKHSPDVNLLPKERFDFYNESETCFAVVQTLERRPYGNVVLTKGVVGPDGMDLKP